MYFFQSKDEVGLTDIQRNKLYLADRLIEGVNKALDDDSANNFSSISTAIRDIVVLEKVLKRAGFTCELTGVVLPIRNSLEHVDERMEKSHFQPIGIDGFKTAGNRSAELTKTSVTMNFQGAINSAKINIQPSGKNARIEIVSPAGMVDDNFLWIDKNGIQQSTPIETIKKEYRELLETLR